VTPAPSPSPTHSTAAPQNLEGVWRTDCTQQGAVKVLGQSPYFIEQYTFTLDRKFEHLRMEYSDSTCAKQVGDTVREAGVFEFGGAVKARFTATQKKVPKELVGRVDAIAVTLVLNDSDQPRKEQQVFKIDGKVLIFGLRNALVNEGKLPPLDLSKPFQRR
jgi:hypothetical protein